MLLIRGNNRCSRWPWIYKKSESNRCARWLWYCAVHVAGFAKSWQSSSKKPAFFSSISRKKISSSSTSRSNDTHSRDCFFGKNILTRQGSKVFIRARAIIVSRCRYSSLKDGLWVTRCAERYTETLHERQQRMRTSSVKKLVCERKRECTGSVVHAKNTVAFIGALNRSDMATRVLGIHP